MITSTKKNENRGGLPLNEIDLVRSSQVGQVRSGQATSLRSGEFSFVQVVRGVPGR